MIICAMLSATTFWSFVREFSPLEMYACEIRLAPLRRCRDSGDNFGSGHQFGGGHRADLDFIMACAATTPDVLGSSGDQLEPLAGNARCCGHLPREDAAREVVNDRMEVGTCSIKKPNQRGIDMPDLIGRRSSNANFRLGWVNALTGTSPLVQPHQSVPCCRGGEDDALTPLSSSDARDYTYAPGGSQFGAEVGPFSEPISRYAQIMLFAHSCL
jgi:hypothetical protein